MCKVLIFIFLVMPPLLVAQRFGESQAPSDLRGSTTEMPSENPIPVELIALEKPIDPDTYLVGPGDQIAISVQTSETVEKVITISPAGNAMIPGVGRIDLRGFNLTEATNSINQAVLKNYKNARVSSELVGIRQIKVAIVGAVRTPGYYTITPVSRLSDVLEMARPRPMALLNQIKVEHLAGATTTHDITRFYTDGDLDENPYLKEGDQVRVIYGDLNTHAIVVRGAVNRRGYAYVKPGETLADLIKRRIDFSQNADLDNIKVVRRVNNELKFLTVPPDQFKDFRLRPSDDIEFLYEKPVNVQGHVASPGSFMFIPGYTAGDYVTLAGGLLSSGTMHGLKITRVDGTVLHGEDVIIQRGDIIEVRRSWMNVTFGEISVIQFFSTMATLLFAVLAVK